MPMERLTRADVEEWVHRTWVLRQVDPQALLPFLARVQEAGLLEYWDSLEAPYRERFHREQEAKQTAWLASPMALRIRLVLQEKTDDEDLVTTLLHRAAPLGSDWQEDLRPVDPERWAEVIWRMRDFAPSLTDLLTFHDMVAQLEDPDA